MFIYPKKIVNEIKEYNCSSVCNDIVTKLSYIKFDDDGKPIVFVFFFPFLLKCSIHVLQIFVPAQDGNFRNMQYDRNALLLLLYELVFYAFSC